MKRDKLLDQAIADSIEKLSKALAEAKLLTNKEPKWSTPLKINSRSRQIVGGAGIGVYKIYHKDSVAEDIALYIGQGSIIQRKGCHCHVFRNKDQAGLSQKNLERFQNSQTKSHAAIKMHDYDPEIDNWFFSFCTLDNKDVSQEYENLLITDEEPLFNNLSMSGVN